MAEVEMTLTEAAKLTGVTTTTLRRAARLGNLRARKAGPRAWLVTSEALKSWLENEAYHRTAPKKHLKIGG
jgi:excisionase family DNA binding protein